MVLKLFKSVTISIALFLILNCKNVNKKEPFDKENFTEHYVDYVKGTLLLPRHYQKVTEERLPYLFNENDSASIVKMVMQRLDADRRDYLLFTNEDDTNDVILIHKSEFMNFSKKDGNQFLGVYENYIKNSYGLGNYKRLQNKISQNERSKYLKIKYKINADGLDFYQTQYVVTSSATTFGVVEIRTEEFDLEDLIKRIRYLVN